MCEVNISNGEVLRYKRDLYFRGFIPVEMNRLYRSSSNSVSRFGHGWVDTLDTYLHILNGRMHFHDELGDQTPLIGKSGDAEVKDSTGTIKFLLNEHRHYVREDGKRWRHHFAPAGNGRFVRVLTTDQNGSNSIQYHYDAAGKITFIQDTVGRVYSFNHDFAGRVLAITAKAPDAPARLIKMYNYSLDGDLVSATDALGRVETYEYAQHLLVHEISPRGTNIYWAFDDGRRCVRTWRDENLLFRELTFDPLTRRTAVTNSLGQTSLFEFDDKNNLIAETDPLGHRAARAFDSAGSLIAEVGPVSQVQSVTFYDASTRCLTETQGVETATRHYFDESGRRVRVIDGGDNEWTTTYDEYGRVRSESEPGGAEWKYEYHVKGYVSRVIAPDGSSVFCHRTIDGRTERYWDDIGPRELYLYDPYGNLTQMREGDERGFSFEYDLGDRVTAIVNGDGSRTRCEYDANDNVVSITDEAGFSKTYEYDAADRPVLETMPDGGVCEMSWDAEGRLIGVKSPTGDWTRWHYDAAGRLVGIESGDGRNIKAGYDEHSRCVNVSVQASVHHFEYDNNEVASETQQDGTRDVFERTKGQIVVAENSTTTVRRQFDARMRLISEEVGTPSVRLHYDERGRHARTELSNGRTTEYRQDARGRITDIVDSRLGSHRFEYNVNDAIVRWSVDGGPEITYTYDPSGRRTGCQLTRADNLPGATYQWGYDSRDLRTFERLRSDDLFRVSEYRHDAMGRVTSVVRDGALRERYSYDGNGNISEDNIHGSRYIGSGDRLHRAGETRIGYDDHGRVLFTEDLTGRRTFGFDAKNRLSSLLFPDGEQATYAYDALGRRVSKRFRGEEVWYGWLGDQLLTANGAHEEDFLFFPGCCFPLAWQRDGLVRFFICDPMGAPAEMIDIAGQTVWRNDMTLWGLQTTPEPEWCPLSFAGHYRDRESGLHYNYHRYYDPSLGRYLTPDPLEVEGGLNLYVGVTNPLTQLDILGLFVAVFNRRCDWNADQMKDFDRKVAYYARTLMEAKHKGGPPLMQPPCASSTAASQAYKKCGKAAPPPKAPAGGGKSVDCTNDIDHMRDKQLGGTNDCANLWPLNSSVNRSMGAQMRRELKKAIPADPFITIVKVQPKQCPPTPSRTASCI